MRKEIGVLLGLAFALTSCEVEERREHRAEEKHGQEAPAAPAYKPNGNGMEKAPEAPKPVNPVQK